MSQPIAAQTDQAPAAMDDTTSAFQDMDLDEPVRRKRRRSGTTKPANPPVLLNAPGLPNGFPFIQSPKTPILGMPALVPDANASNAFTDQVRLQIASIRHQMGNVERTQRALRQQLRELVRFVHGSEEQESTIAPQPKARSAKSVQIRILLHRASPSAAPLASHDFTANVPATRARSMDQFRRAISDAFRPLMIEAYGEPFKLLEGTMKLKSANGADTENDFLFYFDQKQKKLKTMDLVYKSWFKGNITRVTENVPEAEVWDQADRTGQDDSPRKASEDKADDVNMNVEATTQNPDGLLPLN